MKTYIWSVPTRYFHWLMFVALVGAYILGEEESQLNLHTAFGYMAGALVVFRFIWGFVGPKYSRFSDFPIGLSSLKEFFTNMKTSKEKYLGHNPAASLVMLGILLTVVLVAITGMLALAAEGNGPLLFLGIGETELYEELHEVCVNILIGLVSLHLLGILADRFLHGDSGTLFSIFTGYKSKEGESVKLNGFQKAFSTLFIVLAIALFGYGATMQNIVEKEKKGDHEKNEQIKKDND